MARQVVERKIVYRVFNKVGNNYFQAGKLFKDPKTAYFMVMRHIEQNKGVFGRKQTKKFSDAYRIEQVEILTRIVKKNYHTENWYRKKLIARLKREIAAEK